MKKAAPYHPPLSRPLNSSGILGIAVATMVCPGISRGCPSSAGDDYETYHVQGKEEDTQDKGDDDERQLDALGVLVLGKLIGRARILLALHDALAVLLLGVCSCDGIGDVDRLLVDGSALAGKGGGGRGHGSVRVPGDAKA